MSENVFSSSIEYYLLFYFTFLQHAVLVSCHYISLFLSVPLPTRKKNRKHSLNLNRLFGFTPPKLVSCRLSAF